MVAIYSIQNYLVEKFLLLLYYMRLMYVYIINLYTQFYEEYLNMLHQLGEKLDELNSKD